MSKPLRMLIVEDSEDDTLLLVRFLKQNGYEVFFERVDTAEAMRAALGDSDWDLIIADYKMPHFSGTDALQLAKASGLDLPFIIISGVIGEETAVAAMRAGAHDYLMKDNLTRLAPTIERELHEAAERRARKQAELQVHRLSQALEQSASLVMITNAAGKIEYLNPSFSRVTGYAGDEVVSKMIDEWQPTVISSDKVIPFSSVVLSGTSWHGEVELARKTGEHYWASVAVSPINDETGSATGFLIVQEDITERKRLEAELQSYMTRLEQMVEERTAELAETNAHLRNEIVERRQAQAELTEARDQALVALRFKNQILANINHEIRTPLSVINIKVDLLRRGRYGPVSEEQKQALATILDEAQTLLNFIGNLLAVAELEANPSQFEPTRLTPADLIANVLPKLLPSAQAKGLVLTHEIAPAFPETVLGDIQHLSRILFNLVDNAIKFTDQGCVSVRLYQPDSQRWAMQVADTGPGIPADAQAHIFEPFWQVDGSSTRKAGRGVGLGLSVVQKLVTLMAGEIRIVSDGQSGTIFTVVLPIEHPSEAHIVGP